jgi:hypothetical protein
MEWPGAVELDEKIEVAFRLVKIAAGGKAEQSNRRT